MAPSTPPPSRCVDAPYSTRICAPYGAYGSRHGYCAIDVLQDQCCASCAQQPAPLACDFENDELRLCQWSTSPALAEWGTQIRGATDIQVLAGLASADSSFLFCDRSYSDLSCKLQYQLEGATPEASDRARCMSLSVLLFDDSHSTLLQVLAYHWVQDSSVWSLLWQSSGDSSFEWHDVLVELPPRTSAVGLVGVLPTFEYDWEALSYLGIDDIDSFPCPERFRFSCDFLKDYCGMDTLRSTESAVWPPNFHWILGRHATPSIDTGPDEPRNGIGMFVFMEVSSRPINSTAVLETPALTARASCASFWYHMWGDDIGTLRVEVRQGESITQVWRLHGPQSRYWQFQRVRLPDGEDVHVRFVGIFDPLSIWQNSQGDIGLDDIEIGPCTNLALQHQGDRSTGPWANGKVQGGANPVSTQDDDDGRARVCAIIEVGTSPVVSYALDWSQLPVFGHYMTVYTDPYLQYCQMVDTFSVNASVAKVVIPLQTPLSDLETTTRVSCESQATELGCLTSVSVLGGLCRWCCGQLCHTPDGPRSDSLHIIGNKCVNQLIDIIDNKFRSLEEDHCGVRQAFLPVMVEAAAGWREKLSVECCNQPDFPLDCTWTPWYSESQPYRTDGTGATTGGGNHAPDGKKGDWEPRLASQMPVCVGTPMYAQVQPVTAQITTLSAEFGFVCNDEDQDFGELCLDYAVRYCCEGAMKSGCDIYNEQGTGFGNHDCCSPLNPCRQGEGNCQSNNDCEPGFSCVLEACPWGGPDGCCTLHATRKTEATGLASVLAWLFIATMVLCCCGLCIGTCPCCKQCPAKLRRRLAHARQQRVAEVAIAPPKAPVEDPDSLVEGIEMELVANPLDGDWVESETPGYEEALALSIHNDDDDPKDKSQRRKGDKKAKGKRDKKVKGKKVKKNKRVEKAARETTSSDTLDTLETHHFATSPLETWELEEESPLGFCACGARLRALPESADTYCPFCI